MKTNQILRTQDAVESAGIVTSEQTAEQTLTRQNDLEKAIREKMAVGFTREQAIAILKHQKDFSERVAKHKVENPAWGLQ